MFDRVLNEFLFIISSYFTWKFLFSFIAIAQKSNLWKLFQVIISSY